jgi:hypothetical protein
MADKLSPIKKLEVLKRYYIDEKDVKDIMIEFGIPQSTAYSYIENPELLGKFIENLDPFVTKYLLKNSKTQAPYMKMLLENIMHKGTPLSGAIDGLAEAIAKTKGEVDE